MDELQIRNRNLDEQQEADAAAAADAHVHGDILQSIFSHVPLVDLVPASRVSRSWNRAVFSSLRHVNKIKPWLIVHTQRTMPPYATATHAYDPRSHVWIQIEQEQQPSPAFLLRSSHSTLLHVLSPSKFSFSFDPLHLTWHHVDAPRVWRNNPVVALVGDKVIVAGGGCDFEDDPLAVEMYSMETRAWEICQSMPTILKDSAASTWLSVAVNSRKVYVSEKYSGVTYSFDPGTNAWSGPFDLRPDQNIFYSVITSAGDRLIVAGVAGTAEDVKSLKLWEVRGETLGESREIGEMPKALLQNLTGTGSASLTSVDVTSTGDLVYVHNPSNCEELVLCEIGNGNGNGGGDDDDEHCRWSGIKNVLVNDDVKITSRLILTCTSVGMGDLRRASVLENRRFVVRH